MKNKPSQSDIAVKYLLSRRGEWIEGFRLARSNTPYGWLGSQIERRLREIAEIGTYMLDNTKIYIEKDNSSKYAKYRVTGGTKPTERIEIKRHPDGSSYAVVIKEEVKV